MFLPLTRSQDSALFRTFKFIPEAKSRSITVNKIEHNTRIVQDGLIFSTSVCFLLEIKCKQVLLCSLALLCKIHWQAVVRFFLTQMSGKNLKKRMWERFLVCIFCASHCHMNLLAPSFWNSKYCDSINLSLFINLLTRQIIYWWQHVILKAWGDAKAKISWQLV